jgi:hypothetical protein
MSMALFIFSILIILIPAVLVFTSKTEINYGIALKKNWLLLILIAELVLLILAWVDYSSIPPDVASDFMWHNLFIYHRGVLPVVGIMSLVDFEITANSITTLIAIFFTALVVDYLILRLFTYLKTIFKGKPVE